MNKCFVRWALNDDREKVRWSERNIFRWRRTVNESDNVHSCTFLMWIRRLLVYFKFLLPSHSNGWKLIRRIHRLGGIAFRWALPCSPLFRVLEIGASASSHTAKRRFLRFTLFLEMSRFYHSFSIKAPAVCCMFDVDKLVPHTNTRKDDEEEEENKATRFVCRKRLWSW